MITSRSLRAAPLLALLGSAPVFGAAYVGSAYEGFDYPAGTLNALNGGTGWNATGDSSANTASWGVGTSLTLAGSSTVNATGLDYGAALYPSEIGRSAFINPSAAASSIGRQFGQTVDAGTFYFSFLTQKTVAQLRTINFSLFGSTERLAIGQIASNTSTRDQDGVWLTNAGANSGNFAALISNSQNNSSAQTVTTAYNGVYVNQTAPISYAVDTTFLVVGKIEFNFNSGVEDRFTLYINPTDLTSEASLTPYLVIDHNDFGALTGFRMFGGTTASGFTASAVLFDEIRFGNDYLDVTGAAIPEPSAFAALAGLAGLALAASRRRRA